ncbi:MAG: YfiR family protein, partial [Segetibacter sp.]|nr:YfiR family protein [Segetibacter sp.]
AQTSREYNIKAVFLYNFTQFVEWPSNTFPGPDAPFIIGILGDDPFHSSIDEAVANEKAKGHPIIVQRYRNVKDINNCHILFISNTESGKLREILAALASKNILTVSDIPDFATTGGIIRFITKENKIKLQINLPASKDADLNISSKLLQVAEIVR